MLREAVESVLRGGRLPAEIVIVDQSDRCDESLATRTAFDGCVVRYLWEPG